MKKKYQIFKRTWWKENPAWPGGLEPCAGRKTIVGYTDSYDEAVAKCQAFNKLHKTPKQKRLSLKMEFTSSY